MDGFEEKYKRIYRALGNNFPIEKIEFNEGKVDWIKMFQKYQFSKRFVQLWGLTFFFSGITLGAWITWILK